MAQNKDDAYRKFRYYEGVCSANDFIKEIAKVLSLGVRSDAIKDVNGNVVIDSELLRSKNWDIVYPQYDGPNLTPDIGSEELNRDPESYFDAVNKLTTGEFINKIKNQVDQISNTVVLRTVTTPKQIAETEADDISVSGDSEETKKVMYVQFYKPTYLANPEEYPLDAELRGLTPQLITKEMYRDARKSTTNVVFDIAQIADGKNKNSLNNNKITSEIKNELIDSQSNSYTKDELFDSNEGALRELNSILGSGMPIPGEDNNGPTTYVDIPKVYLTNIKNDHHALYNFLFDICGLHSTFTEKDYDLIENMRIQCAVVNSGQNASTAKYYLTLTYRKDVKVYTIHTGVGGEKTNDGNDGCYIEIINEFGVPSPQGAKEKIWPELYSEGRYVPFPQDRMESPLQNSSVTFKGDDIKFSLEKIVSDEDIYYGTIVVRFEYERDNDYVDLSSLKITDSVTLPNYHYCLIRMFDNPASDFSGPEANIYDNQGNVTKQNSRSSPWSKLSWYRDFEEIMMDEIDEDVSISSVTDGTLLVPLETIGLTADTRLSYWINTNNDRFSLIVMGNPALDYEEDRHLISSCYVGRIDSFDNSINDTSGNFALYTSSSTTPCKTVMKTYDTQYHLDREYINDSFVEGHTAIVKDESSAKFGQLVTLGVDEVEGNRNAYKEYSKEIGGLMQCTDIQRDGLNLYYITLTGNRFFNENEMPRYMIFNKETGEPLILGTETDGTNLYYNTVAFRTFIYGTSDSRSNQVALYIPPVRDIDPSKYEIYFVYGLYEQKFVITSGITRDGFGNVIDIQTNDDYGKNTSDGVTSVSMYHTRSKAFYQKHHFLFATTEEYMSKVMYGKSSYTGEYYADRIKITHGNDGPRGILSDTLVIDSSSLYPKDELVINKDFEKDPDEMEETFTYFPITAPFSPLSDGPNARYGIALKKAEVEPTYGDNKKILNIAKNELDVRMSNNLTISDDIYLPSKTENGCNIYWSVISTDANTEGYETANWLEDYENGSSIVLDSPIGLARSVIGVPTNIDNAEIVYEEAHEYKAGTFVQSGTLVAQATEIMKSDKLTKEFKSYVKLKEPFTKDNNTVAIYYGYSDQQLSGLINDFNLFKIIDDETNNPDRIHYYSYADMIVDVKHPILSEENGDTITDLAAGTELTLINAHPEKYLNIFAVRSGDEVTRYDELNAIDNTVNTHIVKNMAVVKYASLLLNNENYDKENDTITTSLYDLLQYPFSVLAYCTDLQNQNSGINDTVHNVIETSHTYNYIDYGQSFTIKLKGEPLNASIIYAHYLGHNVAPQTLNGNTNLSLRQADCIDDLYVNISFTPSA